jgi:hypothetical protein
MLWFEELMLQGYGLLPLSGADFSSSEVLPIAKSAFELLVVKGHTLKRYSANKLREIRGKPIQKVARKYFVESELLRLPGI